LVCEIQYRKGSDLSAFLSDLQKDPLGLDERDPVKEREQHHFQQSQDKEGVNMSIVMQFVSTLQYL